MSNARDFSKSGIYVGGSRKAHAPTKQHPWKKPTVNVDKLKSFEAYKKLVLKKYPKAYLEECHAYVNFEIRVPVKHGHHVLCRGFTEKSAWYNAAQLITQKELRK